MVPEEYKKYQNLIDALEAGDYDSATEIFVGLLPEPELPPMKEVTITADNFLDYFEFREFPADNLNFHRTSAGVIDSVYAQSGFYLKDGFTFAEEKAGECKVEAGVKYKVSWFYAGNKGINVNPATCSYEVTLKPNDVSDEDELLTGRYLSYPDGLVQYALFFKYGAQLFKDRNGASLLIIGDDVELVSASGTLYLYE